MKRFMIAVLTVLLLFHCASLNVYGSIIDIELEDNLIWFGDSRTVDLGKSVYGYKAKKMNSMNTIIKEHVIAQCGATSSWASKEGYRELKKLLRKNPEAIVIINFGVNDVGRCSNYKNKYIKLYKQMIKDFPKSDFYFMSVNPVKADKRNPYGRNQKKAMRMNHKIDSFNKYMKRHLPKNFHYINTNRKIKFTYKDGLHYKCKTSRDIAEYVIGKKKLNK